jgi:hypothetical protein
MLEIIRQGLIDGFRLIDKHNGNIILNFIQQPALVTDKSILGVIQMDVALAFRACQYFQQFLTDRHWILLCLDRMSKL